MAVSYSISDVVRLRACLALASVILVLWGVVALDGEAQVSVCMWNGLFCVLNVWRGWGAYRLRRDKDAVGPIRREESLSALGDPS